MMKEISATTYKNQATPTSFLQTTQAATQRKAQNQTTHFFNHKNEFALLNGTPYKTSNYFTYNIWFPNHLSSEFIKELKTWCKNHNGLSLTITPNTPKTIRDNHGTILKKFPFNQTTFTKNGFQWQGQILTAPGTYKHWQYIFNLDRPYTELIRSFKPKVRHAITTTKKTGLTLEKLTAKNMSDFISTLSATANRRHFSVRNQKYYQDMLAAFGKDAYGLIVYINPAKTRKLLTATIKNSRNIKDGADIIKKAQRQHDAIKDLTQKTPIYASFFVSTPKETVYLAGGGPDQFFTFSPVYATLDHAIKNSIAQKIPRFNLYGTDATFNHPTGLLRFKQQFNGFITELPGDYTANLRPLTALTLKITSRLKI